MKNKSYRSRRGKHILFCTFFLGLLVFVGQASASSTEILQPASTITYNEQLVVNNTGRFNSVYIGKQGMGGVTFFNGTIINRTTGTGNSDNPVTFGDNVRIDGELFRTEIGGNNPIKIADTLRPQTTATYDLGTEANQFRNAYFSGNVTVAALSGTGIVNSTNILDGAITGSDILQTADLNINSLTVAGNITISGTVDGVDVSAIPSTYVSKSSPSWDSQSGRTSIPASSCRPEDDGIEYDFAASKALYVTGGVDVLPPGYEFLCPVQLPDGAIVTSAQAYVSDNGADSVVASFYNADLENFSYDQPRTESSSGLGSGDVIIDLSLINRTVDNSKNAYYLEINFPSPASSDYDFHGAVVNYTYTEPY